MLENEKFVPILCNQENFLLLNNGYRVKQALPDCHIFFKKGEMDTIQGRPKNGMFIAVPNNIKENVCEVSPHHWRIQTVIINTSNSKVLIINTYFSTNPKINDFDPIDLLSTLDAINDVLTSNEYDHVIWSGDFNADFSRKTKFTYIVDKFIKEKELRKSWDKFKVDYTHVTEVMGKTFTSVIDHFCWSDGIEDNVIDADSLYLLHNMSDHCPIYCLIRVDSLRTRPQETSFARNRPSWKNASLEQRTCFQLKLKNALESLRIPDCCKSCLDVHCQDESHRLDCDDFLMTLIECVESIADVCLPSRGGNQNKDQKKAPFYSFNAEIQPFKDKAMFWHAICVSAGRPLNTQLQCRHLQLLTQLMEEGKIFRTILLVFMNVYTTLSMIIEN